MAVSWAWLDKVVKVKTVFFIVSFSCVVQLLISQWTVRVAGNREVLDQISFAGTLISIVLAVVAICYSFYSALSQKMDSDRIGSQLGSMSLHISNLGESERRLSFDLNRLEEIGRKLDSVMDGVNVAVNNTSALGQLFNEKLSFVAGGGAASGAASGVDESGLLDWRVHVVESIFEFTRLGFYLMFLSAIANSRSDFKGSAYADLISVVKSDGAELGSTYHSARGEVVGYAIFLMKLGIRHDSSLFDSMVAKMEDVLSANLSTWTSSDFSEKGLEEFYDLGKVSLFLKGLDIRRFLDGYLDSELTGSG